MTTAAKDNKESGLFESLLSSLGIGKKHKEEKDQLKKLVDDYRAKLFAAKTDEEKASVQTWFEAEKAALTEQLKEVCMNTGYDQKNRAVHLHKKGKLFRVLKSATGFSGKWVGEEEANEIFATQCASTQNQ